MLSLHISLVVEISPTTAIFKPYQFATIFRSGLGLHVHYTPPRQETPKHYEKDRVFGKTEE